MTIHLGATTWIIEEGKRIPLDAKSMKGIFEIRRHKTDQNEDTLKWCFAKPGHPRPTSFEVEKGSGLTRVEFQRFIVDENAIVSQLENAGAAVYKNTEGGWVSEIVLPDSFDSKVATTSIRKLRKLASVHSDVADDVLIDAIAGHSSLRSLRFNCPVRPDQLEHLAGELPNLQTLGFGCKEFTETYCRAIQKFQSLSWLQLQGVKNNLSGLKLFKDKRTYLTLIDCDLDRNCFELIVNHINGSFLGVENCRLSEGALSPLERMKCLYSLTLKGESITDEQIHSIKSQPYVKILEISNTAVTNPTLKHVLLNFPKVFSVRAEHVAFDRGIIEIIDSAAPDRQFDVTVFKTSVTHKEAEKAGKNVAARIRVTGGHW